MKGFIFGVVAVCAALFWWSGQDRTEEAAVSEVAEVSGSVCAATGRFLDAQVGDRSWREDLGEIATELGDLVGVVTGGKNPAVMAAGLFAELERVAAESPGELDDRVAEIASRGADHTAALATGTAERCR